MRTMWTTLSLAGALLAGTPAIAQTDTPPPPGGMRGPGGGGGGMMRADADGDGVVTRAEAIAQAERQFDRMDANHDGKIDASEMAAIRQRAMDRRGDMGSAPMPTPK